MKDIPVASVKPVFGIIWQNFRVLLLALPLGFFSLGVAGILPGIASLAVVGYLDGSVEPGWVDPD